MWSWQDKIPNVFDSEIHASFSTLEVSYCVLMISVGQGMDFGGPLHGIQKEVHQETEEKNCENEAFVSLIWKYCFLCYVN